MVVLFCEIVYLIVGQFEPCRDLDRRDCPAEIALEDVAFRADGRHV